ncbi:cysteine proteinase, partial [Saccharata proteae CBS 121410]
MPDKPSTIVTYAAGASLAAVALVYVFGPTFFLDEESSSSARKRGVVGLSNPANDCFINSVLQALAGLPYLRIYLIREIHRRELDGEGVYKVAESDADSADLRKDLSKKKVDGLQQGIVTAALKDVLDKLNERPIYRKTISAQGFVGALERAFSSRISRQQQDAQEFLQIVTERVYDEYHAGHQARRNARKVVHAHVEPGVDVASLNISEAAETSDKKVSGQSEEEAEVDLEDEDGFPFEGKMESQIECLTCHFKPKSTVSTFVTLTLNVPQQSSTSLNSCFDGMFKIEHIDDFKCEYCRLEHALHSKQAELSAASNEDTRTELESDIAKIQTAMSEDPEQPPKDVTLPDSGLAPKRRIARYMRISAFPKILAIHLSRSIYSAGNYGAYSTKNLAKVAFPENLPLGGLVDQKKYQLLGVVTHKGGHNSGHYESFRRQVNIPPFSTPNSFGTEGVYSTHGSSNPSATQSPSAPGSRSTECLDSSSPEPPAIPSLSAFPNESKSTLSSRSSRSSLRSSLSNLRHRNSAAANPASQPAPTSAPRDSDAATNSSSHTIQAHPPTTPTTPPSPCPSPDSIADAMKGRRTNSHGNPHSERHQRKRDNRWWRISDDKIKESKTSDVLGMQKDVYMLFYEIDR